MDFKQQVGGDWLKPSTWFGNNTAINNQNVQQKASLITQREEQVKIRDEAIAKINALDLQIKNIRVRGGTKSRKPNKKYSRKNH